jgi:lysozyme
MNISPLKTSSAGIDLIKSFEKCKLKAYRDPVGIWTIGWGDTGPDVHEGLEISQGDADGRLARKLAYFEGLVHKWVTAPLTQPQFDCCVSAIYNIGEGCPGRRDGLIWLASGKHSTFLNLLNAGEYQQAAGQLLKWNHAGGEVMLGLTRRREAERALFLS